MAEHHLIPFQDKPIRKVWHNNEWYFSVIDIIDALTDSKDPRGYWKVLKGREPQLVSICYQLKMAATDGRQRLTDCANTEGVFRVIMSVPSPKAEPLKMWLAQVGKERIEETENPELSFERMTEIYRAKGRSDEWIKERWQSITTRKQLTDEWKARGVKEGHEYSILTATIAKGTFGLTPSEHSALKGLEKQNLRDHMTPLELIFTALSEEITRQVAIKDDAIGFNENHAAAAYGGSIASGARERLEREKDIKVVSPSNFLALDENKTDALPPEETV